MVRPGSAQRRHRGRPADVAPHRLPGTRRGDCAPHRLGIRAGHRVAPTRTTRPRRLAAPPRSLGAGCQGTRALLVSAPIKPRGGRDGQEGNLRGDRRGRRFGGGADRLLRRRRFAERHLAGRVRFRGRNAAHAQALRPGGHPDQLVHPRPLDRDLPQGNEGGRGGGARDRAARLHPREPDLDDARARRRTSSTRPWSWSRSSTARRPRAMSRRGGR